MIGNSLGIASRGSFTAYQGRPLFKDFYKEYSYLGAFSFAVSPACRILFTRGFSLLLTYISNILYQRIQKIQLFLKFSLIC